MDVLLESLLTRLANLGHFQIAALASYLLYQGAFLAVFPEELIITTLGFLWGEGRIGFFEALVAIWIGLLPANATTVFIGAHFGPRIFKMRPFRWMFSIEAVQEYLRELHQYGRWIVFITRFTPVIRGPVYLAAGLSKMGVLRFMRTDALASCIQIPALLLLGRWIGKSSGSMMEGYKRIGIAMAVFLILAIVLKTISDRRRRLQKS